MIVKTYRVRDMKEAISKIKKDLGEEAFIVSTKRVKQRSFFPFFKKELIEVVAAVDEAPYGAPQKKSFKNIANAYMGARAGVSAGKGDKRGVSAGDLEERIKRLEEMILSAGEDRIRAIVDEIKHDLDGLKSALGYIKDDSVKDISSLPLGVHKYFTYMCDVGINRKYAYKLATALYNNIDRERLRDEGYVKEYLSVIISQFFKLSRPQKKGIVLVGPTGVGKTTTIAKLSAIYKLKMDRKVGIITTDTYRIGAVDQLLSYAKIMDIPAIVSITRDDFVRAFDDLKNMDTVFIDTVGRSPKDIERLKEIFALFKGGDELHISLVLAVNIKDDDLLDTVKRFSELPLSDLIFTKVDETNTPGTMLNLAVKLKKPISYVSFGQDVPEDIMEADPLKVSSLIIKGEIDGRSG